MSILGRADQRGAGPGARYVAEAVEEVAFRTTPGRQALRRLQRLPISLLENVVSNAERRALVQGAARRGPHLRPYQALPAVTADRTQYEELKGADR